MVKKVISFIIQNTSTMPQLDKLSFATQYFWLTIFFFVLYFLANNFFVILVFKSLKLRNIIYKVWYFFVYKFDYVSYRSKLKSINDSTFSLNYHYLHNAVTSAITSLSVINSFRHIANVNPKAAADIDFNENINDLNTIEIDEV